MTNATQKNTLEVQTEMLETALAALYEYDDVCGVAGELKTLLADAQRLGIPEETIAQIRRNVEGNMDRLDSLKNTVIDTARNMDHLTEQYQVLISQSRGILDIEVRG